MSCINDQSDVFTSADQKTTQCNICQNDLTILNSLHPENQVVKINDNVAEIYLEKIEDFYISVQNKEKKTSTGTPDWSRTTFIEFEDGKNYSVLLSQKM